MSAPTARQGRRRALPRIAGAVAGLVVAAVVSRSVPKDRPFPGGDCGSVGDWASNQDSVCNTPLLNRACVIVALVAIAAVLVVDALAQGAPKAWPARALNVAVWAAAPVLAFAAAIEVLSGPVHPDTGFAIATLAATLGVLAAIPVSAATPWKPRGAVLSIGLVGSAVLFGYAQLLWGGNGT